MTDAEKIKKFENWLASNLLLKLEVKEITQKDLDFILNRITYKIMYELPENSLSEEFKSEIALYWENNISR